MENNLKHWWDGLPSKGGLMGAIVGVFMASHTSHSEDKNLKKAGRTAMYAGAGFLAGSFIEKLLNKLRNS
jgi:hypothetical protein